jgi:hypothetical protein
MAPSWEGDSIMVVVQRNEVGRNRLLCWLTVFLSAVILAVIVRSFSGSSDLMQIAQVFAGAVALIAFVLSFIQLYSHPKRSQVLLIQRDEDTVVATNALHEGFKLRFLRDVLGENVYSFSDEERLRWKTLEADGFYAALHIRNARKLILLRLCTMIFDDVFAVDRSDRWEHHDSSSTAEPSFSKREMPRLTSWKMGS